MTGFSFAGAAALAPFSSPGKPQGKQKQISAITRILSELIRLGELEFWCISHRLVKRDQQEATSLMAEPDSVDSCTENDKVKRWPGDGSISPAVQPSSQLVSDRGLRYHHDVVLIG